MAPPLLRIGTRGSKLALVQAGLVRDALAAAVPELGAPGAVEIVVIRTTGDAIQDRPLSEAGGKGLFVKEIEEALLDNRIDAAVHSMKDMPTAQPAGLAISAFLPREDVRDVLIAGDIKRIADLKKGAVIGSAALRRKAQLLHLRPDLQVVNFRGNVDTRLAKQASGVVDATLLAMAGLNRLGLSDRIAEIISVEKMCPAVGQGALAIETRVGDSVVGKLDHLPTRRAVTAERAVLRALGGGCQVPIGAYAVADGSGVHVQAVVIAPDASAMIRLEARGEDPEKVGADLGQELLDAGANEILKAVYG